MQDKMLYNSGVILIFSVCVKRKNQQKQYAQYAAFHPDAGSRVVIDLLCYFLVISKIADKVF